MKIKVCHITSVHKHNDIRIFIKQCQSLVRSGYDVHYIVPNTNTSVINGVSIHGVKTKSRKRLNRMLITTKEVYKKAIEINAEVYHFHDPELIPIGLKLKRKGKKVIYDVHEDVARTILSKSYINRLFRSVIAKTFEKYEHSAVKKFDYILTATPFIAKRLEKYNPKTKAINNYPILSELFSNQLIYEKKTQLSYVGGISINRGVVEVVEASKSIRGIIKFAGPISNNEVHNLMKNSDKIKYLSILDRTEVKNLLGESLAGIVTFLSEPNHVNAQPNKMFEYMSAGIAVIGSNFPLWKEIIEDNGCGICVNPDSVDEIANAIQYILDNKEQAIEMGKAGRKAIEDKYNWEQEEKKLLKIYEEILL